MVDLESPPPNLKQLGRSMPRERRQNGWVEKTGVTTKTWTGYWYQYTVIDGVEKRQQRSKVLVRCADLTKGAAEDALREHIRGVRPPSSKATFEELAEWYLKTNEGQWSKKWRGTVRGLFRRQIYPRIGARVASEIKRSEVQQALNSTAADPRSQSESIVE